MSTGVVGPESWWYVLKHGPADRLSGMPPCSRDGKIWVIEMPITDGLVPQLLMMCTECTCEPLMVYSSRERPTAEVVRG